jgi:hypothetical protein
VAAHERRHDVAADQPHAREQDRERDRSRHEEGPTPAERRQEAAEHESEREAARADGRVDRERAVTRRTLGERRGDDRQSGRNRESRRDALDEARQHEHSRVARKPAEERGDGEHADRHEEHAPAAEQVCGPAAEQQQAPVAEHVAGDDPLQLLGREAEVFADRRQRDADHRDVKSVEEQRAAEHDQRAPQAGVPLWWRGGGGSHHRHNTCMRIYCV